MKKLWLLPFLFLCSCTRSTSVSGSDVVYSVNQHQLSAKEFSDQLVQKLKFLDALTVKDPSVVKLAKEEVLKSFLMHSLTADFAKTESIVIDDKALEKEINTIRASYPDDIAFRRALADQGISLSAWKDQVRQNLLDEQVFARIRSHASAPTETEIHQYYNENKDHFRKKERVFLRQIVTDQLSKAEAIKEDLKKHDFAEVARKYSVSPEAKAGGAVGWIERGNVDIFDKAFALPVGGTSQILESNYGFHIFRVDRKAPNGVASIDEVKDQIKRALVARKEQAEFMGWLDKQLRTSRILRNNALVEAVYVETRGKK